MRRRTYIRRVLQNSHMSAKTLDPRVERQLVPRRCNCGEPGCLGWIMTNPIQSVSVRVAEKDRHWAFSIILQRSIRDSVSGRWANALFADQITFARWAHCVRPTATPHTASVPPDTAPSEA